MTGAQGIEGRAHHHVYNGMPAADLGEHGWESPWSGPNGGQCVQTKQLADGRVAMRQSTDPGGPALIYTPEEIARSSRASNGASPTISRPAETRARTARGVRPPA